MEFFVLNEGTYAVDKNKNFTLFDPKIQKKSDFKGTVFLAIQPFLVRTSTDIILLDAGLGAKNAEGELILLNNLRNIEIAPQQVTKVLMSHLHKDHVGGLFQGIQGEYQLTFPNATYYISKAEWDWVFSLQSAHYNYEAFLFLEKNAKVVFIEGDGVINQHISYYLTPGHTPFHTAYLIHEGDQKIYFGGDALTMPQQIGSTLLIKSDRDPRQAIDVRKVIVEQAVAQQWICLFYHGFKVKFGRISKLDTHYEVLFP